VLRSLVVLVTIWCTGCSGFEPVLDAALGRSGMGMDCGSLDSAPSNEARSTEATVAARPDAATSISRLAMSTTERGFSCGCGSCHAVTLASWSFSPLPARAISLVDTSELALVSVGRVPLLPPPERTVA
jgi:hypothetical protein